MHYLNSLIVLWEARIRSHSGNPTEILSIGEFPIYEHSPQVCTLGHFPPIRRAFFFNQRVGLTPRGRYGWSITLDAHLNLMLPSVFCERNFYLKLAIDCIFPLDQTLHEWLGGFIRMHGLLRIHGGRANSRETVTTE